VTVADGQACVGRFAPSPTGPLHFGSLIAALASYADARSAGGRWLVRIEDVDTTRARPEFEAAIFEDLAWLGLVWEEPVLKQRDRFAACYTFRAGRPAYELADDPLTSHYTCPPTFFSGSRGLWSYGVGAGYVHRRYARPVVPGVAAFAQTDENWSVYGSIARQLSRTSEVNFDAFASWYSNDVDPDSVRTLGATLGYNRSLFLERLRLMAALGVYNSDDGTDSATNASALGGLRYTF